MLISLPWSDGVGAVPGAVVPMLTVFLGGSGRSILLSLRALSVSSSSLSLTLNIFLDFSPR